jgi:putative MATE family efflux protein
LALPAMASMLFIMVFQLVDAWWVGKLGAAPLAGVSGAAFVVWALESVATLISTGVNAMVARFVGERNPELASKVVGQSVIYAVFLAIVFGAICLFFQDDILSLMGLTGNVRDNASSYLTIILFGLVWTFLAFTVDASFRGMGDTKTPLKIISVSLTLNMFLDPLLIFGVGPLPEMGAAGAAVATVIAHALVVLWGFYLLQKRDVKVVFPSGIRNLINTDIVWRITKIGAPIAFSGIMFSLSYMVLTGIITRFGNPALAAIGLGHRIEGLSYFTAVGFSAASSTLVGQNLGAGKVERAEKAAWLVALYIFILLGIVSVIYYVFGQSIFGFFISDPAVISEGTRYLKIIALFEVFLGIEIVFEGAFSGAGNSIPPMAISVPIILARIPMALYLAETLSMGSDGVWWAVSITTGLKGLLLALWFFRGRWKTKMV